MSRSDTPANVGSMAGLGVTYTIAANVKMPVAEMVESLGQEWMKVPDAWECGLEDLVVVHARTCRLALCRVEKFTAFSESGPVSGGIRRVPIKIGELAVLS